MKKRRDDLAKEAREWDDRVETPSGWVDAPDAVPRAKKQVGAVKTTAAVRRAKARARPIEYGKCFDCKKVFARGVDFWRHVRHVACFEEVYITHEGGILALRELHGRGHMQKAKRQ